MDKNTITGFILIGLLFVVFNMLVEPPPPPETTPTDSLQTQTTPNTTTTGVQNAINPNDSTSNNSTQLGLFKQTGGSEALTTLENDLVKVTLSSKGGQIKKVALKQYLTAEKEPVILMEDEQNVFGYTLPIGAYTASTQDYIFEQQNATPQSITYRLNLEDGGYIEQVYSLKDNSYVVDYDLNLVGFENRLRTGTGIELTWRNHLKQQEKDFGNEQMVTGMYYKEKNDDVNYLSESGDDEADIPLSVDWVSCKQQFFNATLIADNAFKRGRISTKETPEAPGNKLLELTSADMAIEYQRNENFNFPMHFYIGPNDYSILKNLDVGNGTDLNMQEIIPLGWAIFRWVNVGIIIPAFNFLNRFISSYGIIILILTLVIKLVLMPLTYRSYMSFAKMNVLKPDIDALKEKYGKDPAKMQQEQMKLYSKAGVNPLGGCLPQLLQFPILIAMYRFFPASIELRQQSFLWADDLSSYDSIMSLPFSIPFYGDHVSLFTLLSAASSLIYMRLNQQMTPSAGSNEMAQQMKMFQYLMPVMLLFFFNSFASGLTYYFFLSNIISFGQQYAIKNFFIDEEKIRKQIQENKKKPVKKSKFQQRLEAMAKAQQEAQAQQKSARSGTKTKTKTRRKR